MMGKRRVIAFIAAFVLCLCGTLLMACSKKGGGSNQTETPTEYTVTYYGNGGTFTDGGATYTEKVTSGGYAAAAATPTHPDGKSFVGWGGAATAAASDAVDPKAVAVTQNTDYYAIWGDAQSGETATIVSIKATTTKTSYTVGGELDESKVKVTAMYSDGSKKTLDADAYTIQKPDMTTAGSGKTVTVTLKADNSITATFTINVNAAQSATCSVVFSYNYTGAPTNGVFDTQTINKGSKATKPATDPAERDTHTFAGWYTQATGGTTFDFNAVINTDVTVYAHWTAKPQEALDSIEITTLPAKRTYFTGETLDYSDMVVKAYYKKSGTLTKTETLELDDLTVTPPVMTAAGNNKEVTVAYAQKTAKYTIDVIARVQTGLTVGGEQTKTVYNAGEEIDLTGLTFTQVWNDGTNPAAQTSELTFAPAEYIVKDGGAWKLIKAGNNIEITVSHNNKAATQPLTVSVKAAVEFDINNTDTDISVNTKYVVYDQTVAAPVVSAKGYTFDGWYTQATDGEKYVFETTPVKASMTLYAHWTAKQYTVTYMRNGGTAADPANPTTYKATDGAVSLNDPTKDYNEFNGWYKDAEFETGRVTALSYDVIPESATTTTITLYAKWQPEQYNITYDLGSHASWNNYTPTAKYTYGQTVTLPTGADMTLESGWAFIKWYINGDNDKTRVTAISSTDHGDKELKAEILEKTVYTVKFYKNDGTSDFIPVSVIENETPDRPAQPERNGYTFGNWYDAATGGALFNFSRQITSNTVEAYAHWNAIPYHVEYDDVHGLTNNNATSCDVDTNKLTLSYLAGKGVANVAGGWYFKAWYLDAAHTVKINDGDTLTAAQILGNVQDGEIMIYADCSNEYTVTFDSKGGSSVDPQDVEYNDEATAPDAPALTGYDFVHWYLTDPDTAFNFTTTAITADITLNAKWTPTVVTIKLYNNYSASDVTKDESMKVTCESTGTALDIPAPAARTGYTFDGWFKTRTPAQSDTAVTKVTVNADKTIECNVFYAKWTPTPVTITLYRNHSASDTTKDESMTVTCESTGSALTLPERFTNTGYTFAGWYKTATEQTGTAITAVTVNADNTIECNVFYAKWEKKTYTINLNAGDGSVATASVTIQIGDTKTFDAASLAHHTFNGWKKSGGAIVIASNSLSLTLDETLINSLFNNDANSAVTLVADYTEKSYTVVYENIIAGDTNTNPASFKVSENRTLADASRTGWQFKGWCIDSGLNFTTAALNGALVNSYAVNDTVTLYAKWERIQYTYEFVANRPDYIYNAPTDMPTLTGNANAEQKVPQPDKTPKLAGHTFKGWYDAATGGNVFDFTKALTANATVYAQWTEDAAGGLYVDVTGETTAKRFVKALSDNGSDSDNGVVAFKVEHVILATGDIVTFRINRAKLETKVSVRGTSDVSFTNKGAIATHATVANALHVTKGGTFTLYYSNSGADDCFWVVPEPVPVDVTTGEKALYVGGSPLVDLEVDSNAVNKIVAKDVIIGNGVGDANTYTVTLKYGTATDNQVTFTKIDHSGSVALTKAADNKSFTLYSGIYSFYYAYGESDDCDEGRIWVEGVQLGDKAMASTVTAGIYLVGDGTKFGNWKFAAGNQFLIYGDLNRKVVSLDVGDKFKFAKCTSAVNAATAGVTDTGDTHGEWLTGITLVGNTGYMADDGTNNHNITVSKAGIYVLVYSVVDGTAQIEVIPVDTVSVTFEYGDFTGAPAAKTIQLLPGAALTADMIAANAHARTGYNLAWKDGDNTVTSIASVTEDVTLTADWGLINYTITYEVGAGTHDNPTTYNVEDDGESKTLNAATPTASGKIFAGWYTAAENGDKVTALSPDLFAPGTSIKLYAIYADAAPADVTFKLNYAGASTIEPITTGSDGKVATPPADPKRAGYKFDGWFDSATPAAGATAIDFAQATFAVDTDVFAKWTVQNGVYVGDDFRAALEEKTANVEDVAHVVKVNISETFKLYRGGSQVTSFKYKNNSAVSGNFTQTAGSTVSEITSKSTGGGYYKMYYKYETDGTDNGLWIVKLGTLAQYAAPDIRTGNGVVISGTTYAFKVNDKAFNEVITSSFTIGTSGSTTRYEATISYGATSTVTIGSLDCDNGVAATYSGTKLYLFAGTYTVSLVYSATADNTVNHVYVSGTTNGKANSSLTYTSKDGHDNYNDGAMIVGGFYERGDSSSSTRSSIGAPHHWSGYFLTYDNTSGAKEEFNGTIYLRKGDFIMIKCWNAHYGYGQMKDSNKSTYFSEYSGFASTSNNGGNGGLGNKSAKVKVSGYYTFFFQRGASQNIYFTYAAKK